MPSDEVWRAYDEMRGRSPVAHDDRYGGYDMVLRYEDVRKVGTDRTRVTGEHAEQLMLAFLVGGHHSTASGLAALFHDTPTVPGPRDRLLAEPGLVPRAVGESLRPQTPPQLFARRTSTGTAADRTVLLDHPSANRDGSVFDDPGEFDVDRRPNRHLAFGYGLHACVGGHLARAEMRVGLAELLRRLPDGCRTSSRPARPALGPDRGEAHDDRVAAGALLRRATARRRADAGRPGKEERQVSRPHSGTARARPAAVHRGLRPWVGPPPNPRPARWRVLRARPPDDLRRRAAPMVSETAPRLPLWGT